MIPETRSDGELIDILIAAIERLAETAYEKFTLGEISAEEYARWSGLLREFSSHLTMLL